MRPHLSPRLKAVSPNYARLAIWEAFNWAEYFGSSGHEKQWYLVVFRSTRRATADIIRMRAFDDRAYAEARRASGLLFYFRGKTNEQRECLSFCLWETEAQARAATRLAAHEAAAELTDEMYESFALERWILSKRAESSAVEFRLVTPDGETFPSPRLAVLPTAHDGSTARAGPAVTPPWPAEASG